MRPGPTRRHAAFAALALLLLLAGCFGPRSTPLAIPAVPLALQAPERRVSIRLAGEVAKGAPSRITVDDLERLPQTEYSVLDPYTKRQTKYRGVLVRDFVKRYGGPDAGAIRLRALDDFKADLSRSEWNRWDILLATRTEGAHMSIASNGPARIILPYDTHPEINPTLYNDRWIWQINRITFEK